MTVDKKLDMIEQICANIKKKYGKESINYLGNKVVEAMPRMSSQCASLDKALGGGWPIGRIIELFGPESGGKSTVCYHAIAQAQKQFPDIPVALIDVEFSFDPIYAQALGIDVGRVLVSQPEDGGEALNILCDLIQAGVKVVVVDSVAALMPKQELDESVDKASMGLQARLMSQALRKINALAGKAGTTIFFTNQTREKLGVMYGDKSCVTVDTVVEVEMP